MHPRNVLIIDDDKHTLNTLRNSVNKLGHRTIPAQSWKNGLAKARTEHPDIVLIDIMLPQLNVPDFCNTLKSSNLTRQIPIVLVGPASSAETFIDGSVAHADFYVVDNFNPTDLAADLYFLFEWRFEVPQENLAMLRIIQPIHFEARRTKIIPRSTGRQRIYEDKPFNNEESVDSEPTSIGAQDNPEFQILMKMINSLGNRVDALVNVLVRHDVIQRGEIDKRADELDKKTDSEVSWI
jgi:CheY-like chemotaxis protein